MLQDDKLVRILEADLKLHELVNKRPYDLRLRTTLKRIDKTLTKIIEESEKLPDTFSKIERFSIPYLKDNPQESYIEIAKEVCALHKLILDIGRDCRVCRIE